MFMLAYLVTTAIVWILILAISFPTRIRIGRFTIISLVFSLLTVFLFYLFSWMTGLVQFGVSQTWAYPQDYLEAGLTGALIMFLPVFGVLSPVIAAWWVNHQKKVVG